MFLLTYLHANSFAYLCKCPFSLSLVRTTLTIYIHIKRGDQEGEEGDTQSKQHRVFKIEYTLKTADTTKNKC